MKQQRTLQSLKKKKIIKVLSYFLGGFPDKLASDVLVTETLLRMIVI